MYLDYEYKKEEWLDWGWRTLHKDITRMMKTGTVLHAGGVPQSYPYLPFYWAYFGVNA